MQLATTSEEIPRGHLLESQLQPGDLHFLKVAYFLCSEIAEWISFTTLAVLPESASSDEVRHQFVITASIYSLRMFAQCTEWASN